jgi:hypothetical protein
LKPGKYKISTPLFNNFLIKDIAIIGVGKVELYCSSQFATFKSHIIHEFQTTQKINSKDQSVISLNLNRKNTDNKRHRLNALIYSKETVENAWNYPKGELLNITQIKSNKIQFSSPTFFAYEIQEGPIIKIYDSKRLTLKNISFKVNCDSKWDYEMLIRADGCEVQLENLDIENCKNERQGWFMGMYFCSNIKAEDIAFSNLLYGLVFNYSKDVFIMDIYARDVIHPVVPASFTKNVVVNGMTGKNISTDAHMAINVHYKNIDIDTGKELFNCRAFGVRMTNCKIICSPDNVAESVYLGAVSLNEKYKYLYEEYDVELTNVQWKHKSTKFNGLHVGRCRNYIVKNCTTHEVSSGGAFRTFIVENSHIGRLRVYDSNFTISNTIFEASLQNILNLKSPLSCSFAGKAQIRNCIFKGFENTYLFDYIHSPNTEINISNSEINGITGLVKKFGAPGKLYKYFTLKDCKISNFNKIEKEFQYQKDEILSNSN